MAYKHEVSQYNVSCLKGQKSVNKSCLNELQTSINIIVTSLYFEKAITSINNICTVTNLV